jgi:hypothetical protein
MRKERTQKLSLISYGTSDMSNKKSACVYRCQTALRSAAKVLVDGSSYGVSNGLLGQVDLRASNDEEATSRKAIDRHQRGIQAHLKSILEFDADDDTHDEPVIEGEDDDDDDKASRWRCRSTKQAEALGTSKVSGTFRSCSRRNPILEFSLSRLICSSTMIS